MATSAAGGEATSSISDAAGAGGAGADRACLDDCAAKDPAAADLYDVLAHCVYCGACPMSCKDHIHCDVPMASGFCDEKADCGICSDCALGLECAKEYLACKQDAGCVTYANCIAGC